MIVQLGRGNTLRLTVWLERRWRLARYPCPIRLIAATSTTLAIGPLRIEAYRPNGSAP